MQAHTCFPNTEYGKSNGQQPRNAINRKEKNTGGAKKMHET
jgi:hypothetical protein